MTPVFGIYRNHQQADQGLERLLRSGFTKDDISIVLPDNQGSKDLEHDENSKEGASIAVVTSSVAVGGTLGLLAGVAAVSIPGFGPIYAAGPILGALIGLGAGGVVGGIIDSLNFMGIPKHEATRYEGHLKDGALLMSVHCKTVDEIARAKDILSRSGAQEILPTTEAIEAERRAIEQTKAARGN